jgi:preprotein translocase subunit SecE
LIEAGKAESMATTQVETVTTGADKAKVGGAIALVIAGLAAFYLLTKQGQVAQWGALIVALVAAVAVFFTSEPGKEFIAFGRDAVKETKKVVWPEFIAFGRDAVKETKKVVWPTRKESIQMTAYVFGFVVIMALFLWLTDKTLEWVFYDLILGWKK